MHVSAHADVPLLVGTFKLRPPARDNGHSDTTTIAQMVVNAEARAGAHAEMHA